MQILVADPVAQSREELVARVHEALRQAGIKRAEVVDGDLSMITAKQKSESYQAIFLGPGCYQNLEESIGSIKGSLPDVPHTLVLDNERYSQEGLELRRLLSVRIMALADLAQMADFLLDCEARFGTSANVRSRGVITVTQLKGGVGASTIAAGLAACWARHDMSVALVDFDDVNPQLTEWGRVGTSQRRAMSEMLRQGDVPKYRVNELAHPVEGFNGKLAIIGQPIRYQESFHFKADVIEGAPSASIFVPSLMNALREEFDVIVVDSSKSWGITTFSLLPLSQQILLVTDEDGMSVRRTLDNLHRLTRESDDPAEFDLSRWSFVFNCYTGKLLSPKDLSIEIRELDLFPDSATLYTIPYSAEGRQWGGPGQSFYDLVDDRVKQGIKKIAFSLVPFRQEAEEPLHKKFQKHIQKLVQTTSSRAPTTS